MKNNTMLSNILSVFLGLTLTAGCTQSNSTLDVPHPESTETKKDETLLFQKSYGFSGYGGCETQEQTFSGSSLEEVNSKYCDGLQDGERNNYCAESERLDAFLRECPSSNWNPRVKGDFFYRENQFDLIPNGGEHLFESLSHMRAVSILSIEDITASQRKIAYLAFESFKACGFSHTCFDPLKNPDYGIMYKQVRWSPENVDTLIITLGVGQTISIPIRVASLPDPKYFVLIKRSQEDKKDFVAEIWEASQPVGFRSYKEFFSHSTSVKRLVTFSAEVSK